MSARRTRSSVPSAATTCDPRRSTIARKTLVPGCCSSRTIESASITTAPCSARSRATVLFPAPMPPVNPTSSIPLFLLFGSALQVGDDRLDRLFAERLRFGFVGLGFRLRCCGRLDLGCHRGLEHVLRRDRFRSL